MIKGVIKSLKAKFYKNIVQQIIRSLKKNKALPPISNLNGTQMLAFACNSVSIETILNYFRKA